MGPIILIYFIVVILYIKRKWDISYKLQKKWHKCHKDFQKETDDILGYEYVESIGKTKILLLNKKASKAIKSFVKYMDWTNYPPGDKTRIIMEYMPFATEREKVDLVRILLKPDTKLYLIAKVIRFFPKKMRFSVSKKYYKDLQI